MPDVRVGSSDVADRDLLNVGGTACWVVASGYADHLDDRLWSHTRPGYGTALGLWAVDPGPQAALMIVLPQVPFSPIGNWSLTEVGSGGEIEPASRVQTLSGVIRPLAPRVQIAGSAAALVGHIHLDAVAAFVEALSDLESLPAPVLVEGFISIEDPTWRQLVFTFQRRLDADERSRARHLFAEALSTAIDRRPDLADEIADEISVRV